MGLFADAEGEAFAARAPAMLPPLLLPLAEAAEEREGGSDGEEGGDWRAAHLALCSLEKTLDACPDLPSREPEVCAVAWEAAAGVLSHPHAWVRRASGRVVGRCLADDTSRDQLLSPPGAAGRVALGLFLQLQGAGEDEALCTQAVKCLVSVLPDLKEDVTKQSKERGEDEEEEEEGAEEGKDGGDEDVGGPGVSLHGLMRRMSRLADDNRLPRKTARMSALR